MAHLEEETKKKEKILSERAHIRKHLGEQVRSFIRTRMHHEYHPPQDIGAIPPEMRLTAPTPWGGIVFMMNTRPDEGVVSRVELPSHGSLSRRILPHQSTLSPQGPPRTGWPVGWLVGRCREGKVGKVRDRLRMVCSVMQSGAFRQEQVLTLRCAFLETENLN